MDLHGEQIVRDVKRSALFQEELKTEILSLNGKIALESQNLSFIKREGHTLISELSNKQEAIQSLQEQEEFLTATRDANSRALLWRLYFKKYIANMEPDNGQMKATFDDMQGRYTTLINRYEEKPEYRQIIEAETTTRQLTEKLGERRNELMKLETEREY